MINASTENAEQSILDRRIMNPFDEIAYWSAINGIIVNAFSESGE